MEKRETWAEPGPAWSGAGRWLRLRDALVTLLLILLFHDLFIRILGTELAPLLTGFRIPPLPWRDAVLLALLLMGVWRMAADPTWRRRFAVPYVWWQVVCLLVCAAFLSLQLDSMAQANEIKGLLYPLLAFGTGILTGFDWRKVRAALLVIAAVNIAAALIISLLFMDQYRLWMDAYRTVFGESAALTFGKFEQLVVVPMPLILERTVMTALFVVAGAIAWHQTLSGRATLRLRIAYALLAAGSLYMVLASFSRGGILTMFAIYIWLYVVWAIKCSRSAPVPTAWAARAIVLALAAVLSVGLLTAVAVRNAYGIDLLDPTNLISATRAGRITIWSRVADDITRQHGWLTGIKPSYRTARASIVFGARGGQAWSEWAYYTVDNAYLYIVMHGGLFALAALLAFVTLAAVQLARRGLQPELAVLVSGCLIWWMLATSPLIVALALLIGGGRLGNLELAPPAVEPAATVSQHSAHPALQRG